MAAAMRTFGSGDIVYGSCDLEDIVFAYNRKELAVYDGSSGQQLDQYDGIFFLGWFKESMLEDIALSVARYAEKKHIPVLNPEVLHLRSRSKLSQYVVAAINDVSITEFVVVTRREYVFEALKKATLDYPIIVKAARGSRGANNFLVRSEAELQNVYNNDPERTFVIQRFIPNEGDYRLLVMGDTVRLAIHRRSQTDSHVNNTSQGGAATLVGVDELNPDMLIDAVKIATLLRRPVTGIDMIVHKDTNEYFLLEANNMPQLSTGSMVQEKMQALDAYLGTWLADQTK